MTVFCGGGKRCRYGYIVGAIHESPVPRWQIPPWPDEWHTAANLTVGADDPAARTPVTMIDKGG
jgi:hypothetical protein